MKKRLLVFSVDAMVCEDLQAMKSRPNFRRMFEGGCEVVGGMRSIYPTVTYPNHVSMITGCYAGKHGVVSNNRFTITNKEAAWNWFSDAVQVEDIFAAAKRAGYTTACMSWPVTGCNKNVDYLMDEYWMPEPGDTLRSSFARAGSCEEVLELIEAHKDLLPPGYEKGGRVNVMKWPWMDEFILAVTTDVIRKYRPELLLMHTGTFDHFRHTKGVFGEHLEQARDNLDRYLGQLLDACEAAGVLEDTNFVMVSDHGQRSIRRVVHINVKLADYGLIRLNEDGTVKDWDAYSFSNAMSTNVYVRDPSDPALVEKVHKVLLELRDEGVFGIGEVFTAQQMREREQLYGDFSFVIESDGYTSFGDRPVRPLVQNYDLTDYRFGRATHGYYPDLGPKPVFMAKGPDFKQNVTLERGLIVDEAPTYARLLGVELPQADGKAMEIFLA